MNGRGNIKKKKSLDFEHRGISYSPAQSSKGETEIADAAVCRKCEQYIDQNSKLTEMIALKL